MLTTFHFGRMVKPFSIAVLVTVISAAIVATSASAKSSRPQADSRDAKPVKVEIFESLSAGAEFELADAKAVEAYRDEAVALVRFPTKYSRNALPLDRSTSFVVRATLDRDIPAGEYQFRLRARGATRFLLDDKVLLSTKPQKANSSGHDPVPPEVERADSPLRPAPYPHQEEIVTVKLDGNSHRFTLVALIGGKGLSPSPGELSVSFGRAGEVPRLLGGPNAPLVTDEGWEAYATAQKQRHATDDVARRCAISAEVAQAWDEYHRKVRQWVNQSPAPAPPKVASTMPVFNNIDRFIGARLEAANVPPTPLVSDLEFLRRLSLDTIGVIPTAEEVRAYLKDAPGKRRQRAIDRLLSHPSWADHWVSYWQDVLAENPGILKPDLNNSGPFRWWLHQSFTDGLPFDRLVAELIQMEGSALQGAPAAFAKATLNDAPMAAKADIIAQAFLAEKLSCARCHNAPYHPWTQKNLFSLGAMLEGKALKLPASSTVPFVEGFRKPKVEVTLKPGELIEPAWPFAKFVKASAITEALPINGGVKTRSQVAALIVSPANDRFAKVIVNRVWKRYLGAGLVDPAEDWNDAKPSHPELLDYLAREFVLSGYDLKSVSRLIFSSHLYQRQAVTSTLAKSEPEKRLFAGPVRRRMSAEQLVDSLHFAVGKNFACEELNLNPAGNRPLTEFLNMGTPQRAWEFTAMMNERDRPALALPVAQSVVDVLCTFGWRQARQNPATVRDDSPSPMQTLLLANGIMGTRVVRLSDDSAFTKLALENRPLDDLVNETFLRVLSRPPSKNERRTAREFLGPEFSGRKTKRAEETKTKLNTDQGRVTWGNHLSAEATLIRMEEERRLRLGDAPTGKLKPEFRERYEDFLWSLVNAPEFVLVP